jgi:hypothetical protein
MDNYFLNYIKKDRTSYIIPEISVLNNNIPKSTTVERITSPIQLETSRATEKFNPYVFRVSHPIALEVFVYGPDSLYYKVIEGLYMLEDGTMKLRVKKKYGK